MTLRERVLDSFKWKKNDYICAQRLGISVEKYTAIKIKLRAEGHRGPDALINKPEQQTKKRSGITAYSEDLDKGEAKYEALTATEPRTTEEIIEVLKLDTTKWKLSTFWNKEQADGTWRISALVTKLKEPEQLTHEFIEFLKNYVPAPAPIDPITTDLLLPKACLIFNKQDAHLNKYDIEGYNDINDRLAEIEVCTARILKRASITSNVEKTIYILGSDLLDAEWTEMTTKGTPQKTLMGYHKSFETICNHEVRVINTLLRYSGEVEVIFIPGNHDQFAGWHIVNWLKAYFKNVDNLDIITNPSNTKYYKYGVTAMMFNHGDGMKPEKLAQVFPLEFKKQWGNCDQYCIFTGDKHHELSRDIGGIRFFRIAAMSSSKSNWDSKHGWTMVQAEMTAYLFREQYTTMDILKEPLGLYRVPI